MVRMGEKRKYHCTMHFNTSFRVVSYDACCYNYCHLYLGVFTIPITAEWSFVCVCSHSSSEATIELQRLAIKIRPIYGPFRSQNWLKWKEIYNRGPYSTPQSCTATHSHPQTSTCTPDCLYRSSLCFRKAASKSRLLNVACFECWIK